MASAKRWLGFERPIYRGGSEKWDLIPDEIQAEYFDAPLAGAGNASGALPTVTLASLDGAAVGSTSSPGNAAGDLPDVTASTSTATARGAGSAAGALDTVTLATLDGSAASVGGSTGDAAGVLPTVAVSTLAGSATGSVVADGAGGGGGWAWARRRQAAGATGSLGTIDAHPPQGYAEGARKSASAEFRDWRREQYESRTTRATRRRAA